MELSRVRTFLFLSLLVIGLALFNEWQREHAPHKPLPATSSLSELPSDSTHHSDVNHLVPQALSPLPDALIDVTTDVLKIKIDLLGGDIVSAELSDYPQTLGSDKGVQLLDNIKRHFIAQTGLISQQGPDSRQQGRARYHTSRTTYSLQGDELKIDLHWQNVDLKVIKTYSFKRGSYLVGVSYQVDNTSPTTWQGTFYGQLRREFNQKSGLGLQTYQGGAVHSAEKPYKKLSFSSMKKKTFSQQLEAGWAAFVEHYFLCAWIAPQQVNNYYSKVEGDFYHLGTLSNFSVPAHSTQTIDGQFFIGPELPDVLKHISPGLELTVDYGILWPISQLLFWLLKNIYSFVGNWGVAIILVTMVIKLFFYKFSASSYRSMGQMRNLQPRLEQLKETFANDKQQLSLKMMELYRKEKINPLGGCLPIIIQIPVFIALYYVLLESIELRQAPFYGWIQDLSSRDPFYILPLIMGLTMFLQQKMNPAPPDPLQAKVMMLMPVIFTALFISFPAGLVLYWTANNVLSVAQQWLITRTLEKEKAK